MSKFLYNLAGKTTNAKLQVKEFMTKFEGADEQRRRLDKHLFDAKREISNQYVPCHICDRIASRAERRND